MYLQREQPALPVGRVRARVAAERVPRGRIGVRVRVWVRVRVRVRVRARVAAERVPDIARLGRRDRRGAEAQLVPGQG